MELETTWLAMFGAHPNVPDFSSIGIYNAPKGYDYESTMQPNNIKVMCNTQGNEMAIP